jgi:hypothetical protein
MPPTRFYMIGVALPPDAEKTLRELCSFPHTKFIPCTERGIQAAFDAVVQVRSQSKSANVSRLPD